MTNTSRKSDRPRETMGPIERITYELVEMGKFDAAHAILYARPIRALAQMGLVQRRDDGSYVTATSMGHVRPSQPPEEMVPLVCRVPRSWIEQIDEQAGNGSRSEAARALIGKALAGGSGTRRAVGGGSGSGR